MRSSLEHPATGDIRAGARIVNAHGVSGTLGCFAVSLDDEKLVFLSCHHVVFGAGGKEQERISIAAESDDGPPRPRGRARHGRFGTIRHDGNDVHVDCATAELDPSQAPAADMSEGDALAAPPIAGELVAKNGAASGTTQGIVAATDHVETVTVAGRKVTVSGQILVRPTAPGAVFTADGDSGAVLRNVDGAAVGLLWGMDPRGFGLACPIAPVLGILHIRLARSAPRRAA